MVYPNGRAVGYDYGDASSQDIDQVTDYVMSRLSSIFDDTDADGVLDAGETVDAAYKYLGAGTIVEEDYVASGTKLTYDPDGDDSLSGFDRFGRVAKQIWTDYGADPDATLDGYTYTYDRAGNRTSKTNLRNGNLSETYTYNDLDELASTVRADGYDQTWTYDAAGNIVLLDDDGDTETRETNAANEIESITGGTVTPSYDAAGNMIYGPKAGDEATGLHYVYDAWNRLVAAYEDDDDGVFEPTTDDALTAAYEYDGTNRRITKTLADDTGVEYFYNQKWQILEERAVDDEGATTAVDQYVWSPRYIDAPAVRYHDGNGDCDTSTDAGDTIRYYAGDANYNVTTTVTYGYGNTSTTEHYVYSAYGEATEYSSAWAVVGAPAESGPLYCGYMFDAETSNYLARHRYYNSSLATWISRDPIGYDGGDANLYRYVGNSPLNATDPEGTFTPRPQTDAEKACCAKAYEGVPDAEKPKTSGATICCDSKPTICHWASEDFYRAKGFTSATAIDIFQQCVYDHEDSHFKDTMCRPDTSGFATPQCPEQYDPTSYQLWSECKALQESVTCMDTKKCKEGDDACKEQVKFYHDQLETKMNRMGCADLVKNGPERK